MLPALRSGFCPARGRAELRLAGIPRWLIPASEYPTSAASSGKGLRVARGDGLGQPLPEPALVRRIRHAAGSIALTDIVVGEPNRDPALRGSPTPGEDHPLRVTYLGRNVPTFNSGGLERQGWL